MGVLVALRVEPTLHFGITLEEMRASVLAIVSCILLPAVHSRGHLF